MRLIRLLVVAIVLAVPAPLLAQLPTPSPDAVYQWATETLKPHQTHVVTPINGTTVPMPVVISWMPATGATSFDVYFGPSLPSKPTVTVTALTWTPPALIVGTRYVLRIDSRNSAGVKAGNVNSFTVTAALSPLGTLTVAWDANPPGGDATVGYEVAYGTASQSYTTTVDAGAFTTLTLTGLKSETIYYLAVRAYDAAAVRSAYSLEVSGPAK